MRRLIAGLGVLTLVLSAVDARAAEPTKAECLSANTEAQTLRREKKLRASRAALRVCVGAACPGAVRDDCAQRLDDLERLLPTIVFEVKDGAGRDLTDVKVTMDGEMIAAKLDGTALAADPGEHAFVFEVAGQAPVTQRLVVREGDRGRRERITFANAETPTVPISTPEPAARTLLPDPPPPSSERPSGSSGSGQRIAGLVIGGAGLGSLAVGGVFGVMALSDWRDRNAHCGPGGCSPQGVSSGSDANTAAWVADVAVGAGLLAIGVGAYLLFATPSPSARATASRVLRLTPAPFQRGGGVLLGGGF